MIICCGHNASVVVTILLLQVIGSTTAKISRVGHAHPDFFQGGRLPTLLPPCRRPCHVTRVSDTTFKVRKSKVKVIRPLCSPPCWRFRRLQRWAWECVGRGKLLLRCPLLGGARRFAAREGGEGRGHILAAADLQLVWNQLTFSSKNNMFLTFTRCSKLWTLTTSWLTAG